MTPAIPAYLLGAMRALDLALLQALAARAAAPAAQPPPVQPAASTSAAAAGFAAQPAPPRPQPSPAVSGLPAIPDVLPAAPRVGRAVGPQVAEPAGTPPQPLESAAGLPPRTKQPSRTARPTASKPARAAGAAGKYRSFSAARSAAAAARRPLLEAAAASRAETAGQARQPHGRSTQTHVPAGWVQAPPQPPRLHVRTRRRAGRTVHHVAAALEPAGAGPVRIELTGPLPGGAVHAVVRAANGALLAALRDVFDDMRAELAAARLSVRLGRIRTPTREPECDLYA